MPWKIQYEEAGSQCNLSNYFGIDIFVNLNEYKEDFPKNTEISNKEIINEDILTGSTQNWPCQ